MLRFSLLGSGSSGNAALVVSDEAVVLIDCGLSFKRLCERTESLGVDLRERLDAVFITHEHGDHILGLGALSRKLDVPIYVTYPTRENFSPRVGVLRNLVHFEAGDTIHLKDMEIASFSVAHDAADPVSFTVGTRSGKVGFATDLGHCSQLVRTRLAGSHALVLESNYCPDMLRQGDYPAQVQQRIRSRLGHLSNQDMNGLLSDLIHDALKLVVLVHISEKNNTPERAQTMAERVMRNHAAQVHLAGRDGPTQFFEVMV